MPNWCDTTYKCVGDLKEVRSLYRILKYIDNRKTPIVPNGFGNRWLGNLVTKLGGNWESCRCRGEILDYHIDGNVLTIYQSTAWCEQEGVREIIEKAYPSIKVYYREEEPGAKCIAQTIPVERIFLTVIIWMRLVVIRNTLKLLKMR